MADAKKSKTPSEYPIPRGGLTPLPRSLLKADRDVLIHLQTITSAQERRIRELSKEVREISTVMTELRIRMDNCVTKSACNEAQRVLTKETREIITGEREITGVHMTLPEMLQKSISKSGDITQPLLRPFAIDEESSERKMSFKSWASLISALITIILTALGATTCVFKFMERQDKTDLILLRIEEKLTEEKLNGGTMRKEEIAEKTEKRNFGKNAPPEHEKAAPLHKATD